MIPLSLASILLVFAIVLSVRCDSESIVSLSIGTVLAAAYGVSQLRDAVIARAANATPDVYVHLATSIALTASAALFARLLIRRIRQRRILAQ